MKNTIVSFGFVLFCVVFFVENEVKSHSIQDSKTKQIKSYHKTNTFLFLENMPIIIIKRD